MPRETRVFPLADHIRVDANGRADLRDVRGNWRRLKPGLTDNGYPFIRATIGGKRRKFRVHLVVLWAWAGPPEAGQVGRHLDDRKRNCKLSNLAWGTHAENMDDAKRNGKMLGRPKRRRRRCRSTS